MSKEALKMALGALEVATTPLAKDRQEVLRAITATKEALAHPEQEPVARIAELEETVRQLNHALREATEAPTFMGEPVSAEPIARIKDFDEYGPLLDWYKHWVNLQVGTRFYTTPPQPKEQEDLKLELALAGLVEKITGGLDSGNLLADAAIASKMLDAQPKEPEQEPAAYGMWDSMIGCGGRMMYVRLDKGQDGCTIPLYTTPPKRKPLTDEQREEIAKGWRGRNWTVGDIIDAIEAAHGIKE